jgi:hypothetical protein
MTLCIVDYFVYDILDNVAKINCILAHLLINNNNSKSSNTLSTFNNFLFR